VTDLAAIPLRTHEQLAIDDDASANTYLTAEVDHVRRAERDAAYSFGNGPEIAVVPDHDRCRNAQRLSEHLAQWHIDPSQVRSESHHSVGLTNQARHRDTDPNLDGTARGTCQEIPADRDKLSHYLRHRVRSLAVVMFSSREDNPTKAHESGDRSIDTKIDRQDVRSIAHWLDAI